LARHLHLLEHLAVFAEVDKREVRLPVAGRDGKLARGRLVADVRRLEHVVAVGQARYVECPAAVGHASLHHLARLGLAYLDVDKLQRLVALPVYYLSFHRALRGRYQRRHCHKAQHDYPVHSIY